MESNNDKTVGVIIITHCAKRHLKSCLPPLLSSPIKPRVLVVNSSSNDGTIEEAKRLGAEIIVVPRYEFNQGSTREMARKFINTDIVVMMTPDAYPTDEFILGKLIEPLVSKKASVAYSRQIPHDGADIFEAFSRTFNYPENSHIRGIEDINRYGVMIFHCSNSCAAYLNDALDEIGGFKSVLTNEDYFVVAELMLRGHRVAYVADTIVKHSHRYSLLQEFSRYFDTGYVRAEKPWINKLVGNAEKRGQEFVISFIREIYKSNPILIFYAFAHILTKWLGYRIGFLSLKAPLWLKKLLSSQDYYWVSKDFLLFRNSSHATDSLVGSNDKK